MKPRDPKAIKELFDSVSSRYDFLNDLFSFGLHRLWKRKLLIWLAPSTGEKWIDLCCGTGDLTVSIARLVGPSGSALGLDFSEAQIFIAKKRSASKPDLSLSWLSRDALNTCLPPSSFDGVVMAYGLRNLQDPEVGLNEIFRLLKPGAKAGVLDFNRSEEGSKTSFFQKFYLRRLVVPIASILGLREEYAYLEKSLQNFPSGFDQREIALNIGFKEAEYRLLAAGQMGALLLKK